MTVMQPAVRADDVSAEPTKPDRPATCQSSDALQWLREIVAAGISIVILVLTSVMLMGTYSSAGFHAGDTAEVIAAKKEANTRQKDIMLFGLALLGTVTGYYLGRVPAEMHAREAQQSATTAQDQLHKTQDKLTQTAGSAAAAASQAIAVQGKLSRAAEAVTSARDAISNTLGGGAERSATDREATSGTTDTLIQVRNRLEQALREIRG